MSFSLSTPLIIGNWKMHKTVEEALEFEEGLFPKLSNTPPQVGLAVPYTAIFPLSEKAKGSSLWIGAQNMNDVEEGAFTGEIAGRMLLEAGASFVLLGHSERREHFGETSEFIGKKIKKALASGLFSILCVGEKKEERAKKNHKEAVTTQLKESLKEITKEDDISKLCIAYEPIWAIGSFESATKEDIEAMHKEIRKTLLDLFGDLGKKIPILYGGSVQKENAATFLQSEEIQGLLVGGASLSLDHFAAIIEAGAS